MVKIVAPAAVAALLMAAFACNGGEEAPRTTTPA